ncbi:MAG: GDP-perosamine N-acetyltransferase [Verrucomicrobia subdivision 3 bacterium]|nr:GDP-perosamine N-acetyltransferase [Limisphaerales bacterium]MCS1415825.1 GDP-perosamine N-acetyltransferase [Limisphaerales bacterium]
MKTVRKLVIVGAGGYGMEALWLTEDINQSETMEYTWEVLGFADDNLDKKGEAFCGYRILGTTEEVCRDLDREVYFHCAIGNNVSRQRVAKLITGRGFQGATLIHPSVVFHHSASAGPGAFVSAGSVVAPMAKIGAFAIVNILAGVGHHSVIGDFAQVCPGARVNGWCKIGELAFIGSNASIQPGKSVGQGATLGANAFASRSLEPFSTVVGPPSRTLLHSRAQRS